MIFKSRPSNGERKPYFIDKVTILSAQEVTDRKFSDKAVTLVLDTGQSFNPLMTIEGKFGAVDAQGEPTIGSCFHVQNLFEKLGISFALDSNAPIDTDALAQLNGKTFWRLRYAKSLNLEGKVRFENYQEIENGEYEKGAVRLESTFKKDVAKGFPKSYHPELLNESTIATDTVAAEEPAAVAEEAAF